MTVLGKKIISFNKFTFLLYYAQEAMRGCTAKPDQAEAMIFETAQLRTLVAHSLRRLWPRFMVMRTLMVGCVAGEGHIDDGEEHERRRHMECLARTLTEHALTLKAGLIVLKEFTGQYRQTLRCFLSHGFVRVPSLPMTGLNIEYESFEDYTKRALKSATRAKLRRKFRAAETAAPLEMEVVTDVSAVADEIYPLYLEVYHRSKLRSTS